MDNPEDLAPVEMGGFLDRKHEQQSGGKRAAIRSWKSYYTGIFSLKRQIRASLTAILFVSPIISLVWPVALFLQGTRRLCRKQSSRFAAQPLPGAVRAG